MLAALVALTTAVVLSAVAGARRGDSVIDRLLSRTEPATIAVLPNQPGFDWDVVEAIDGVESLSQFPVSSLAADGIPGDAISFVFDEETMHRLERPVVLDGRVADTDRDDEVTVTAAFEGTYGKGVGDHVTLRLFTPKQIDDQLSEAVEPKPAGPVIDAVIVGVVRSPWFSDYGDTSSGTLIPSAGLLARHRANLVGDTEQVYLNALVRLEDGAAGIPAFRERLAQVSGREDIEFFNLTQDAQHVRDVTRFEADALLAFALAAAVAALFLIGQSVVRFVAGASEELEVLRAVGMSPRQVRALATTGPTVAGAVGALAGAALAMVASSRFPIGTARPFEPTPGARADAQVLGIGCVLVVALVSGGALLSSWIASRTFGQVRAARPSRLASLATRLGAPVPTAIGTRFAVERGAGSQSVPVLPAIVGAIVGVLGIVAALTFANGIDDATSNPERFGVFAQLEAYFGFNGEDFAPADQILPAIAGDPDVVSVNEDRNAVADSHDVDVTLFTIDPVDEPPPIVLLDGALPASADEVALAPTTADDLGAQVGDVIDLTGADASNEVTVTGLAFVPEGPHNEYDTGAWLTTAGLDRIDDGFKFHFADVTLRDGADVDAAAARINREVAKELGAPEGTEIVTRRGTPSRAAELQRIGRLPLFLAGFLALLAVTAVGHAVATAVRRRRHDLAVLRAIGLTRGQTRRIALVQATVLALIGVVIGVPLGVALGRSLWRSVAASTPVLHIEPLAVLALALIAPVAVALANLLAAWPSQRAARLRVGQILRTE
ncbi:MAG: ABC transporter permease [Acidimicrobiales bacterium]